MDGSGTLFERHVIAQDAEGIAIQEWVAEDGFVELFCRGRSPGASGPASRHASAVAFTRSSATI